MFREEENTLGEYIRVDYSSVHGKGLFAIKNITEGTLICYIEGEVIDEDECVRRENDENNEYIFWQDDERYIDVSKNKLRYLNHDCTPNCFVEETDDDRLYLVTEKYINAGEEITIDYDHEDVLEYCTCEKCEAKRKELKRSA